MLGRMPSAVGYQPTLAEQGIYPAVDPLESSSRILEKDEVGQGHYETARKVSEIYRDSRIYVPLKETIQGFQALFPVKCWSFPR